MLKIARRNGGRPWAFHATLNVYNFGFSVELWHGLVKIRTADPSQAYCKTSSMVTEVIGASELNDLAIARVAICNNIKRHN